MTRLRKMMLEELQRRNYSEITTRKYLQYVTAFARHFGKPPDQHDRSGKRLSALSPSGRYFGPKLSCDGKRVTFESMDSQSTFSQIWISDARI